MASTEVKLNVLLIDDEVDACQNLRSILLEYIDPDINIMGIANSTAEAEKQLELHNPDAVFLDIEMPGENAFAFLERIAPVHFEVVFVTAYDEYAVKAFKLNAVDYVLKPISISELSNAVARLKEKIMLKTHFNAGNNEFGEISKQINSRQKLNKIALKGNNNVEIVAFKDILYVEAFGGYSKVFFYRDNVIADMFTSYAISEYEEMLPQDAFYRVHKSYLINCDQVKKIHKDESPSVSLQSGQTIPVSRRRFAAMVEFMQTKPVANA